jgi:hypothetical protein
MYPVSATETDLVIWAKESFWTIVTPRSDDETETEDARYHESLGNVAPAEVYLGRAEQVHAERDRIKRMTIAACSIA